MAIYRPLKPRWPAALAAGIAGVIAGVLIGWVTFGRSEPDPKEALARMEESFDEASSNLEIVVVEYDESVDGTDVVNQAEYEGAQDAFARSRSAYLEFHDAAALIDRSSAEHIDEAYEELERLIEVPAPPEEVEAVIAELGRLLEGVVG